jgi:AcrR family transcriptional regulator
VSRQTSLRAEDILDAAYDIIRTDGLDALTMQRLAGDLGVTVKAVYNHVANKAALLQLLVDRIWQQEVSLDLPADSDGLVEWLIQFQLLTRRVWLDHLDLATLAMAVSEPDDVLMAISAATAGLLGQMGVQRVGLVYNALQTYTMGSVAVAASRRRSSAYFGRDPDEALAKAYDLAEERHLSDGARAVIEAQWDEGDEKYFEEAIRVIVAALLPGGPAPASAGNGASGGAG